MIAMVAVTAALAWFQIEGNGVPRKELRPVDAVHELSVSSGLAVSVTVDPDAAQRVVVSGDENVVARVATEVRRGRLRVFAVDELDPSLPLKIELTVSRLERVDAHGAARVEVAGATGESFVAEVSEASHLTIAGRVTKARLTVGGASHVQAQELEADELTADVRGASAADVRATRAADVAVQSASIVHVTGSPAKVVRRLDASSRLAVD